MQKIAPLSGDIGRAFGIPLTPKGLRLGERNLRIDSVRRILVRRVPSQGERDALAFLHRELRDRAHVFAARVCMRAEAQRIRSRDCKARVVGASNPRHDTAVVEADDKLRPHLDAAAHPLDDAHDVRRLAARRHEVEDAHDAFRCLPGRLEHHRVVEVSACRLAFADRCEQPAAVLGRSEQRGEAGARVEAGETQPIDRTATLDQRSGLQVPDERIVLDARHQRFSISRPSGGQRFCTARLKAVSYSSALVSSSVLA